MASRRKVVLSGGLISVGDTVRLASSQWIAGRLAVSPFLDSPRSFPLIFRQQLEQNGYAEVTETVLIIFDEMMSEADDGYRDVVRGQQYQACNSLLISVRLMKWCARYAQPYNDHFIRTVTDQVARYIDLRLMVRTGS